MNVKFHANNSHPLAPIWGRWRIARLARFGAAINLALMTIAISASAQEPKSAAPVVSSEWRRMLEGLKKAKPLPIPEATMGLRSAAPTESGDLVRFDALTGQVSRFASAKADSKSLTVNREDGNLGAAPIPADGNTRVILGDSPEDLGVRGVVPLNITPNPPRPLLQPYIFQPYKTEFRLLMRFVTGFGDRFYLCSASSASSFHLISAGHCIYNHDPLGDKSGRGAGYAAEIWAWPAETDFVDPLNPDEWPDFPWGVAKMTHEITYGAWIDNADFNWDISFIALDRRIGDHVGWMAREWGVNAATLFYTGYPAETPYVPSNNPFQYPGADDGNVRAYTCCRIQMDALTYGGHSGGAVFRCCSNGNYVFQGVNSTSTRVGYAEATLFTAKHNLDLVNMINIDRSAHKPVDRAQLIEYLFDNDSKGLFDTSVALGEPFAFRINAFNAGYIPAADVMADMYLTESLNVDAGTFIGTIHLGDLNANQFIIWNTALTMPNRIQPGNYSLTWKLSTRSDQYFTDQINGLITKDVLRVVGLSTVLTDPIKVTGGTKATGAVLLTSPAPPNGLGHGIDVLLSSDNPAAQFINFVHVKEGAIAGTFDITTAPVKQNTTVTITANLHGITKTTSLLITPKSSGGPPALNALALQTAVLGGNSATATVNLTTPAPAGGITVKLSSSNAKAVVPASVLVTAGSTSATFMVKTSPVAAPTAASIKASYLAISKTATLTINPVQPKAITLSPSTLKGGAHSVATITINGVAPPAGATISLTSSNAHGKVPATVHVNPGSSTVTATVSTTAVTVNITATIKATSSGVSKSADLTIQH